MKMIDTQPGFLRLTLHRDDDGTGELVAQVSAGGFAGTSSAWFHLESIAAFARRIGEFPIDFSTPPELAGGYWDEARPASLKQTHLSIRVYPVTPRGQIGVRVVLATDVWPHTRAEERRHVETELLTSYQALAPFSASLIALTTGSQNEAVLSEDLLA